MKALIIYESMFGNTLALAEQIAKGMTEVVETELTEVGDAPAVPGEDIGLLVIGGPTHAFSMSRATTRESAREETDKPLVSKGIGIREWLEALPRSKKKIPAAAFDSRVDKPRLPGSAAAAAEKRLKRAGYRLPDGIESFYVEGMTGPLVDGELERARAWGKTIATDLLPEAD